MVDAPIGEIIEEEEEENELSGSEDDNDDLWYDLYKLMKVSRFYFSARRVQLILAKDYRQLGFAG